MALSRKERDSLQQSIADKVMAEVRRTLPQSSPGTDNKVRGFAKTWGPTITALAGVVAIVAAVIHFFNVDIQNIVDQEIANKFTSPIQTQINRIGDKIDETDNRLSALEGKIGEMSKNLDKIFDKELRHDASLPQSEFDASLPKIQAIIRLVSQESIDPDVANELRRKMTVASANPDWPIAAILINASSRTAKTVEAAYSFPAGAPSIEGLNLVGGSFDLDEWTLTDVTFENAVIRYHGGPVIIKNVHFINCRFDFQIREIPSPAGQELTKAILASNISSVAVD